MAGHILTGFGFGPIQSGLFASEAFKSKNFSRIVVLEVDQGLVDAVRANKGTYFVNVAKKDGIAVEQVDGIEIYNPSVENERETIIAALAESTEITTCLPSVAFYTTGGENSVANLIAQGLSKGQTSHAIIYTAENNNHAAEILQKAVVEKIGPLPSGKTQFLNTVIGKMSRVAKDPVEIGGMNLKTIAPQIPRAFLVEEFNRILVSRCKLNSFKPGIEVFVEKNDLIPFEEAKLYGHNAIHALLAYLGDAIGYQKMTELKEDKVLMKVGREAFLRESGAALIKRYASLGDELFTENGYKAYAEDLLERMTNPYLADTIARAGRDAVRKLGYNDRIFGTMVVVLEQGVEPANMALGAFAGIGSLLKNADENNLPAELRTDEWPKLPDEKIDKILRWIWSGAAGKYDQQLISLVELARPRLISLLRKQSNLIC